MKKLLMIAIAVTTLQVAQAQTRLGIKAGVNFATYVGDDVDDADMLTSFYGGLFVNLHVSDVISIQPEVLYSVQGAKSTFLDTTITSKQEYINIPLMLQLNLKGFYGEIGPQLGILMASEISGAGITIDTKDQLTSTDIGLCIGAGFKFENGFGIGARYAMGLTSLDNVDDGYDSDYKNSVISLGLLYSFGSK